MDDNLTPMPIQIVTLPDEQGNEVDYELDATYLGGKTAEEIINEFLGGHKFVCYAHTANMPTEE